LYSIQLDPQQGKLSQPCFVSYDPEAFYSSYSDLFPSDTIETIPDNQASSICEANNITDAIAFVNGLYRTASMPSSSLKITATTIFIIYLLAQRIWSKRTGATGYIERTYPHFKDHPSNAIKSGYSKRENTHGTRNSSPTKNPNIGTKRSP
jgi:hypothetical protein